MLVILDTSMRVRRLVCVIACAAFFLLLIYESGRGRAYGQTLLWWVVARMSESSEEIFHFDLVGQETNETRASEGRVSGNENVVWWFQRGGKGVTNVLLMGSRAVYDVLPTVSQSGVPAT